jgi:hypothetical protein
MKRGGGALSSATALVLGRTIQNAAIGGTALLDQGRRSGRRWAIASTYMVCAFQAV